MKKFYRITFLLFAASLINPSILHSQKAPLEWTILETYTIPGKASGLAWDGQYLYSGLYSAPGDDNLIYKIDLSGAGNPDIEVPETEHDYGMVTIDETTTWGCLIQNNGTAELEITYGSISGQASEYIGWPMGTSFSIPAGETQVIDIDYTPGEEGQLDALATLETNDPVTPEVELHMTGVAVYSGPHLEILIDHHSFGDVRVGAHTRWEMEVINKGDEPLVITSLSASDNDNYYIDQRLLFPVTVESLETSQLGIWFNPNSDAGDYPSTVSIISNDPDQDSLSAQLEGSGLLKDWEMGDIFWQYTIEDPIDASPKAMSGIQDVTGDGIEDLIICSEDSYIRCFNGNSHGTADVIWETEIPGGSVYHQNSISRIPDIDGDGYEDIVIGTAWADRSVIALSGYSGEEIWKYQTNEFGDGGWVYQVNVSFDYNNDQFLDVLAATGDDSGDTGPKRAFCLNGKTGIPIWNTPFNGPVFSVIGIEDFTGDGQPDAIAGVSNESETEGSFYSIDGSTGLSKWHFVTNGSAVWALAQIDDINENNTKDIMAGVSNGEYYMIDPKTLFILKYSSIGNFLILRCVVIDDITRDDYKDVLLASSSNRVIVIDGAEAGYAMDLPIADKSWVVDRIDDVSGDDQNDVVAGSLFSNNYAYFVDTYTTEVMFEDNYNEPLDAIKSINDINNDWSMEMVAGGRNGKITCYSGGLDAPVGIPDIFSTLSGDIEHGSYPNPFSSQTTIFVNVKESQNVTINIYNQQGKLIEQLSSGQLSAGSHEFIWDSSKYNSGIFFYNILTPKTVVTGKLIMLR